MAINYPQRYDDDFLNTIKTVIDHVNIHGKTMQDLVAEGQLTEEQYAELLTTINGLLKSGHVDKSDLTSEFKDEIEGFSAQLAQKADDRIVRKKTEYIGLNDASPELLAAIEGGENASFKLESIPRNYSVTPKKTTFFEKTKNLFEGHFERWSMNFGAGWASLVNHETSYGGLAVAEINPNTTYTVTIYDEELSDRFRLGTHHELPESISTNSVSITPIINRDAFNRIFTFTTDNDARYLFIYVSSTGQEPRIQVEEGERSTEYVVPFIFSKKHLPEDDKIISNVVVEDPQSGYAPRPNLPQVIWIGVNEPTDAEPFDEWREVGGFYYFNDFDDYVTGESPNDWDLEWGTDGTYNVERDGDEKALRYVAATTGINALSWSALDEDNKKVDAEVFVRGRLRTEWGATNLGIVLRGSGNRDNATGYVVGARENGIIRLSRYSNGSTSTLIDAQTNVKFEEYFNLLARIDDNRIRVKCWKDGAREPDAWLIDTIDSQIFDSGFIGISSWLANYSAFVERIGIATGGERAPQRRLI